MMTGLGEEFTERTILGLGALELIRKPFGRPALVRTLKQVLQNVAVNVSASLDS